MKHVLLCIITICSFICNTGNGQVFIKTVQTPQVRDRGVFNRSNRLAEIRLSETDKEASIIKENRISKNNLGRFDHKFETLLSPIKNAVWEEDSKKFLS